MITSGGWRIYNSSPELMSRRIFQSHVSIKLIVANVISGSCCEPRRIKICNFYTGYERISNVCSGVSNPNTRAQRGSEPMGEITTLLTNSSRIIFSPSEAQCRENVSIFVLGQGGWNTPHDNLIWFKSDVDIDCPIFGCIGYKFTNGRFKSALTLE